MVKKSYTTSKIQSQNNNSFYNKLLNRIIFVLIALIFILIIKTINTTTTKNIIQIIETNIKYDFSLKSDGKRSVDYIKKLIGKTKESIEIFNIEEDKKILNN